MRIVLDAFYRSTTPVRKRSGGRGGRQTKRNRNSDRVQCDARFAHKYTSRTFTCTRYLNTIFLRQSATERSKNERKKEYKLQVIQNKVKLTYFFLAQAHRICYSYFKYLLFLFSFGETREREREKERRLWSWKTGYFNSAAFRNIFIILYPPRSHFRINRAEIEFRFTKY